MVFHPKGELVATGGFDGTLRIFETATGKTMKSFIPVPRKIGVSMKRESYLTPGVRLVLSPRALTAEYLAER